MSGPAAAPAVAGRRTPNAGRRRRRGREGNLPALRKDLLCLINEQRRKHARKPLKPNKQARQGGERPHEGDGAQDCLSHKCGSEPSLQQRIDRSGYLKGAPQLGFAENTGCAHSIGSMIANWMASKFHRLNILGKKFKDIGIAISKERVPSRCSTGYVTFVLTFGFAKR